MWPSLEARSIDVESHGIRSEFARSQKKDPERIRMNDSNKLDKCSLKM